MSGFRSFSEFYPYYLSEHKNPVCRRLHYIGSTLVLVILATLLATGLWSYWWLMLLAGYGFAWVGHFKFEHNKPATFKYPFYSLAADWVMYKDFLTGQLEQKLQQLP
ncbi:MAG: DUF962 domain-containing protein [Gammaproteobacteria bacterium]|nr:DUF962 domain-containing protein [Gammaproteobacteria bacterium]MBU2058091.1 DUF962 domain-containing protein [Gammaproteobacteria bacterium]MBU2175998.1 DUF962 domain-containing protein [Gammaproteobacteria bacterium]MBU2247185.1 DUF962 domain-containing protein [Gammaproteobacteria bacterium]MBU2343337.1 DUF962 domain-containing protein [Gammaproteobacteria bacterium]